MRSRDALLLTAAAAAVLAAPAPARAAWTTPVTVDGSLQANPVAQGAFGGSVVTGWLEATVALAKADGDGFTSPARITTADPYEKAWEAALSDAGEAVVITVRRHAPTRRIRATLVSPEGAVSGPVTISDGTHSATQPQLAVAPDGSAVAAWNWHDPAGWRVQVAIRRAGEPRFDAPQLVSPPGPTLHGRQQRPWVHVGAGTGGRAVVTWQIGGDYSLPESTLHVLSAGSDGRFGADQELAGAGGLADVGLAVGPSGAVQVAYLDQHYSGHEAASSLRVSQGVAGAPLSEPVVLSRGGRGTSSGPQVAAGFSGDGSATVAWARPGTDYEEGGDLEVFTRPAGGEEFGPAQRLDGRAQGIALAVGQGGGAVLAWMHAALGSHDITWSVHAATRPGPGSGFGAAETISAADRNALWPSVAMTPAGDAIATWITNKDGSGGGQAAAAVHRAQ